MIVNLNKEDICRRGIALIVCLLVAGNSVQGTVLCFGADGHIEFESVFHEQCKDHGPSRSPDHSHHPSEGGHEHDDHCHSGQCTDVPISFGLAANSKTTGRLNSIFAAVTAGTINVVEQSDRTEELAISNAPAVGSYFSPLRTVILLA